MTNSKDTSFLEHL